MKVTIKGRLGKQGMVEERVDEVIHNMAERIGVPDGTKFIVEGLEFKVIFVIDGVETYASVPRDINGETVNEIFEVVVDLDEDGNIVQTADNEAESLLDGFTLANSIGQEYQYEGVESGYSNDELEVIDSVGENTEFDVMSVRYQVIGDPDTEILRHFKGNKLVAEYTFKPKETPEIN